MNAMQCNYGGSSQQTADFASFNQDCPAECCHTFLCLEAKNNKQIGAPEERNHFNISTAFAAGGRGLAKSLGEKHSAPCSGGRFWEMPSAILQRPIPAMAIFALLHKSFLFNNK
jgi:hypothetical protein